MTEHMTQLQWLESLEGLSRHEQILLKYSMRSQQDVADDLEMERRRTQARERQEDYASQVALGLAPAHTHQQILDRLSRACEIQDSQDRAQAAREARGRAEAEAVTFRQLCEAQQSLAASQRREERLGQALSKANDAAAGYYHQLHGY